MGLPRFLVTLAVFVVGTTRALAGSSGALAPLSVSFTSPAQGATVGGTLTVSGTSSGASKVELRVDSGAYMLATGTSTWSIAIDTRAYANGSHNLEARATSSAGRTRSVTR